MMQILTYAEPESSQRWQQCLNEAGLPASLTGFAPPTPPPVQVFTQQEWDAVLIEYGLEEPALQRLAEAQQTTDKLAPVFVLGGDMSPEATREALRRGATACLGDQELGCLPQMLQQASRLSYLCFLLQQGTWSPTETAMPAQALAMQADIGPALSRHTQDLDNQIMSITLYVELLMEQSCTNGALTQDLGRILAAAEKAGDLVQQVRALYHMSKARP